MHRRVLRGTVHTTGLSFAPGHSMLDPQARSLLQLIEERGGPPFHLLVPEEARRAYRERRFFTQPAAPEVASVYAVKADGPAGPIPLRVYRPLGADADVRLP